MAGLYDCPNCNTRLRVPEGVRSVRCPKCQSVLTIEDAAAPIKKSAVRARLVDEKADAEQVEKAEALARRKQVKKELAAYEQSLDKEDRRYQRLRVECSAGRKGLKFLRWGTRCLASGVGLELVLLISFVIGFLIAIGASVARSEKGMSLTGGVLGVATLVLLPIGVLCSLAGTALISIGMGKLLFGPKVARHLAIVGLVVTILHVLLALIQGLLTVVRFIRTPAIDPELPMWLQMQSIYELFGVVTELPLLSEHPARFLFRYPAAWFGLLISACEFIRLITIGLAGQALAEGGKSAERGHKVLKWSYRTFWVIMMCGLFRILAAMSFDWVKSGGEGSFMVFIGLCVHGLITFLITAGISMSLYNLSLALGDVEEVVDPLRYLGKGIVEEN